MNKFDVTQTTNEVDSSADLARANPPARSMLTYRGGKYRPTRARMLASLSSQDALARLNQDADNDWSIALLHAWSIVTDVLGFYQERITNEGYIRTASERRSVLALARALGYDWRPALAANADLALTVAPNDQGQSQSVKMEKGSAIQTTPAEGKQPLIFETSTEAEIRTEWNLLYPYVGLKASDAGEHEPLPTTITSLRVANYRSDLQKDNLILLVDQDRPVEQTQQGDPAWVIGKLTEIIADPQKPYTVIRWSIEDSVGREMKHPALYVFRQSAKLFGYAKGAVYFDSEPLPPPDKDSATKKTNETAQPLQTNTSVETGAGKPPDGSDKTGGDSPTTETKQANWTPRTLSLPSTDINAFVANRQGTLFAGTKRDLFRSTDTGESWQAVAVDPIGRNITALTIDSKNTLFAASSTGGIYLSYDNGDNWTPLSGDSVAPDVKVTKAANGETFQVDPPEILPKSPVLELEFGTNRAGDPVLYALASEKLFASENNGKTWKAIEPGAELPATIKRPNALDQRKAMVEAAQHLFTAVHIQWLQSIIATLAAGVGVSKWAGIDVWKFLVSMVRTQPPGAATVRALAVSPPGKPSTVVVGTDVGKFTLKEKTRRWLVATVIALLVLLQQYLTHPSSPNSAPFEMLANGTMVAQRASPGGTVLTPTVELHSQGTVIFEPATTRIQTATYTLTATGNAILPAQLDETTRTLHASGMISFAGKLLSETTSLPSSVITLSTLSSLTATLANEVKIAGTLFAITTTKSIAAQFRLTATALVTPADESRPLGITLSNATISGDLTESNLAASDVRFPWLNAIWQQVSALLQTTVIGGWNLAKGFLSDLWAALPGWLQTVLTPIYDLIAAVVSFVDTYLIQPLLNYTAATLLDISAITLGVLALLLAWIYADHKMSNRKTVRLEGPVNALAIHRSGQIFAGTAKGVFRSLADDPNASWWTKATRALIRRAFPDVPMEPINAGLSTIDPDSQEEKTPDIRTLAFTNSGALLAGTADGSIYRLSYPTAEFAQQEKSTSDASANASTSPAPLIKWEPYDRGLKGEGSDVQKNALKTARTIAVTPVGQFVAGGIGTDKVEDRWFSAQICQDPNQSDQKINRCEIDLDRVSPSLAKDMWLIVRQPQLASAEPNVARYRYLHHKVNSVETVRSRDFVTVGEFTRAIVLESEQSVPANQRLATFSRTHSEIWLQSDKVDLFDNRPVHGTTIYLNGYVADLRRGHRLIINGKQKVAVVTVDMKYALRSMNQLEWRSLTIGDVLHAESVPHQENVAVVTEKMIDALRLDNDMGQRTLEKDEVLQIVSMPVPLPLDLAVNSSTAYGEIPVVQTPLQQWRLRTKEGMVGTVDAAEGQVRLEHGLRWRLRTVEGFVGEVIALEKQIRWTFPSESEPEISEVVQVLRAEEINLPEEAALQAKIDFVYGRVILTKVELEHALMHVYDRATVSIFGNVVAATHGQTVKAEVLGSGSGMRANERFVLHERPLTYLSSANKPGYEGEIKVKVNDIEWHKEPHLYNLTRDRRAYVVRQDALDHTYITFGDGKQGARLPTGTEQVTATYRIGSGKDGNVAPNTIDQPQTLPSVVRRITNPLPASGGVDPDTIDNVRARTPLSVRIMDRIVTLSDYEDYVRLFAGIGRVQLNKSFGSGLLHLTIADSNGGRIEAGAPLLLNLLAEIDKRRTSKTPRLQIESYEQLFFEIAASVLIAPEHKERVCAIEEVIRTKLLEAFSFAARAFGQSVAESEVVKLLQTTDGVAVVEKVRLKLIKTNKSEVEETPNEFLPAQVAHMENGTVLPAQLLLLNPTRAGVALQIAAVDDPSNILNHACAEYAQ